MQLLMGGMLILLGLFAFVRNGVAVTTGAHIYLQKVGGSGGTY